jgi:hypothetical protein
VQIRQEKVGAYLLRVRNKEKGKTRLDYSRCPVKLEHQSNGERMKNLTIGILLAAALVFGGLYFQQTRRVSQMEASVDGLRQKLGELQSGIDAQDQQAARLRTQLKETRADAAANINEALQIKAALKPNPTNQAQAATPTNAKPSNALAEMFKNPAMREMIKNQQKTALGGMIDKNYAKLFSDLHLTPEQSSALKDMILNKQLAGADMGMSMMSDDMDATKRADLVQQIKTQNDTADAQIKSFLGDDNFAQLQTYEKSMGERTTVSGFADQFASGPSALTDDQQQQLIQAMSQERQNFKFTTDFSDKSKFTGDMTSMFTEENMNTFFQESGQLNQQYLNQAQGILSPDQLAAFQKYLDNQQTMQKAGMQMAAKMFAPAK